MNVTDLEVCEHDFFLPDGTEGGMPHLHRQFHHLQFVVMCIGPLTLPQGYNSMMEDGIHITA
jgi:hypothetical protein